MTTKSVTREPTLEMWQAMERICQDAWRGGYSVSPEDVWNAAIDAAPPAGAGPTLTAEQEAEVLTLCHALIEAQLPEDEPDYVPDWVCLLLFKAGRSNAGSHAVHRAASVQPVAAADCIHYFVSGEDCQQCDRCGATRPLPTPAPPSGEREPAQSDGLVRRVVNAAIEDYDAACTITANNLGNAVRAYLGGRLPNHLTNSQASEDSAGHHSPGQPDGSGISGAPVAKAPDLLINLRKMIPWLQSRKQKAAAYTIIEAAARIEADAKRIAELEAKLLRRYDDDGWTRNANGAGISTPPAPAHEDAVARLLQVLDCDAAVWKRDAAARIRADAKLLAERDERIAELELEWHGLHQRLRDRQQDIIGLRNEIARLKEGR